MKNFILDRLRSCGTKCLLAAIAALGLALPGAAFPENSDRAVLDYVCEILLTDCTELDPPKIKYFLAPRPYGYYDRTTPDTIYINYSIAGDPVEYTRTVIHETVHYVHIWARGEWPRTAAEYCLSESMAWGVENIWAFDNGYEPVYDWRDRYDHC